MKVRSMTLTSDFISLENINPSKLPREWGAERGKTCEKKVLKETDGGKRRFLHFCFSFLFFLCPFSSFVFLWQKKQKKKKELRISRRINDLGIKEPFFKTGEETKQERQQGPAEKEEQEQKYGSETNHRQKTDDSRESRNAI